MKDIITRREESNDEEDDLMNNYPDKTEVDSTKNSSYHHIKSENIPSQTHGLVTTVPQNIVYSKIGDKHSPTRNSLRHSRMIVMNKTDNVPTEYLPPIIKNHDSAMIAMWIILIIGIIMSFECSSVQIYAPNSKPQLNPVYTAVPILLSGIFGFVHLRCCRKEYPGVRRNICEKSIKVLSISTSLLASVTSFIYIFNGLIHLMSFFYLECAPPDLLTETCFCNVTDVDMETSILNNSWNYVDLSCFEVHYVFNSIIALTSVTCLVIIFLEIHYLNLHWVSRSEPKPEKDYSFI